MNPCGQWKVLRLSIRLLRTLNGGLRPLSGIPDYAFNSCLGLVTCIDLSESRYLSSTVLYFVSIFNFARLLICGHSLQEVQEDWG